MPAVSISGIMVPAGVFIAVLGLVLLRRKAKPGLAQADLLALRRQGALVLDVRTAEEFRQGHLQESLNLPLGSLSSRMGELPKNRAIITVCASGMRSGMARRQLLKAGFQEVHNGGPWQNLQE